MRWDSVQRGERRASAGRAQEMLCSGAGVTVDVGMKSLEMRAQVFCVLTSEQREGGWRWVKWGEVERAVGSD